MKRPYKIITLNSIEESKAIEAKVDNKDYNPADFMEFNSDLDMLDKAEAFEISDTESIYFLDEADLGKLTAFLTKMGYEIQVSDATDEIFYNKISIPTKYKAVISEYIVDNFSVNDVLDKMNEVGYDCITEFDKLILKNQ